jgi:predicted alpha/beta superfamily hydrolase
MQHTCTLLFVLVLLAGCSQEKARKISLKATPTHTGPLSEFSTIYTAPVKRAMYSSNVKDSFTIFQSIPSSYNKDSAKQYPLVILLDANAFFEPLLGNLKFNTFIGDMDESIITGIGYKDFPTMDSLRNRDYTYPAAIPEYEMSVSGGADKFKKFIDEELLPEIKAEYKIDSQKIILCGHSLGGYFVLYYMLTAAGENKLSITNFVSASPSLHYNNRYMFGMETSVFKIQKSLPAKLYISMGSKDMEDKSVQNILGSFAQQMKNHHYADLQLQADEYSSFGHIDAALPGFAKGLSYVFAK